MVFSIVGLVLIVAGGLAVSAWGIRRRHARHALPDMRPKDQTRRETNPASDAASARGDERAMPLDQLVEHLPAHDFAGDEDVQPIEEEVRPRKARPQRQ